MSIIPPANRRMSSKYDMYDEIVRELDDPMLDRQQENIIQQMIEMGLFDDYYNTGGRVGMQTGGTPDYQEILQQIQDSTADMEQTSMNLPSPQVQALQGGMGPLMAQQLGTPIDTSAFAPQAAAQTGLQQAAAQQAATQAGLGTLQFDPTTGQLTSTGTGTGIAGYQPFQIRLQLI